MLGLLADVNFRGQLQALLRICNSPAWQDVWASLGVSVRSFEDIGLLDDASDATVWACCQSEGIVLVTDNRNQKGPDSLDATIRMRTLPSSLPVVTIANTKRVLRDRRYAERVAVRLMEVLIDIDLYRGVGRIFIP